MAYTPYVWTSPEVIEASDLDNNNRLARNYVNYLLDNADFTNQSLHTVNFQASEYWSVLDDWTHMSGSTHSGNKAELALPQSDWLYHTATIKNSPADQTLMDQIRNVSVPEVGRAFYLEAEATILIHFNIHTRELQNDPDRAWSNDALDGAQSRFNNTPFAFALDGQVLNQWRYHSFEEEPVTIGPAGAITYETPTANSIAEPFVGLAPAMQHPRRCLTGTWMFKNLPKGWHTLQLVTNPRNELGCVVQRSFTIETFYTESFAPADIDTIAYRRRLTKQDF